MRVSITKTSLILFFIFLLALVLRVIAASNAVIGSDELAYSSLSINILSAHRLLTWQQSHLYFLLNDLGHVLMGGVTPISTRLPSILFGAFGAFVVFLLGRDLFGRKEGLIAAFLFAVSGYLLQHNIELDMPAFFFALLSIYFFLHGLRGDGKKYFYLSAAFFGISLMIKNLVVLFVPACGFALLYHAYMNRATLFSEPMTRNASIKSMLFTLFICAIIILTILFPVFAYNYILYKEKHITDIFFSMVLGIGDNVYQGFENNPWSLSSLLSRLVTIHKKFIQFGSATFFLGLIGLFFSFVRRRTETLLFFLSIVFLFAYVAGITASAPHYLWVFIILSIFGSTFLSFIDEKVVTHFNFRHITPIILLLVLIISLYQANEVMTQKNAVLSLREYVAENIPSDAIVVLDPRIYRGVYAWAFNDVHYIEGTSFPQLIDALQKSNAPKLNIPIYYIECGKGTTCIWSTEDYNRIYNFSEQLSSQFHDGTQQIGVVKGEGLKAGDRHTFVVYRGTIGAPPSIYESIDRTHTFWFYPVGWKYTDGVFDNYTARGFDRILELFGFFVLYVSMAIAVLSLPFVAYLALNEGALRGDQHE